MADKASVLESTIQLALEAAEAANDAAAELTPLKEGIESSTGRLDTTRRFVTRSVAAALGAATLMLVMAALIYFQTLSNLRMATASQIETMALLTENIAQVEAALVRAAELEASIARLDGLEDRVGAVVGTRADAMREDLLAAIPEVTASAAEIADALDTQLGEIVALNADLEAALSQLIVAGFDTRPTGTPAAGSADTGPAAQPATPPRSAPTPDRARAPRAAAPRPEPNPFSFP